MPSNTGGRSVNSGTVWPGTNSARSIRISIVDGATWTVTPRWWQTSTSSTARSCGKSGSAMITSWIALGGEHLGQLVELAERAQPVLRAWRQREVADDVDRGCGRGSASACATASMCLPEPTSTARRR